MKYILKIFHSTTRHTYLAWKHFVEYVASLRRRFSFLHKHWGNLGKSCMESKIRMTLIPHKNIYPNICPSL